MSAREDAMLALFALASDAYAFKTTSRRLKLWADVPVGDRPALYQFEGGNDAYTWSNDTLPKRALEAKWFVYIDSKDQNVIGASAINDIIDAFDAALAPEGRDAALGRQTLGGKCFNARIEGQAFKDPGDLDGDGLLIVTLKLLLP